MLFPRALGAAPAHRRHPRRRRRGPARGLVARHDRPRRRRRRLRSWSPTAPACRSWASTRGAGSPVRTCAATASAEARWTTWFRPTGQEVDDTLLVVRAEDQAAGLALVYELETVVGGGLRGRGHRDQHRRGRRTSSTASRWCCPCAGRPRRAARLHRPARARAQPAAAHRHRRALAARGPGRSARAGRRHHGRGRHAGSPPRTARSSGVHVGWSGNSVLRVERSRRARRDHRRRRAAAARRGGAGAGRVVRLARGCTSPRRTTAWTGSRPAGTSYQRSLAAHPAHQPVVLNVWEAVFFDHDLDRLRADRRPGGRASASSGSCSTTAGSTTGATTPPALGDWMVDAAGVARRAGPARRPRAGAGHGVRALVRAGDGQPRLRPLPRAPRWILARRRPDAAAAPPPAGARPGASRGRRPPLRPGRTPCSPSTPSTT